MLGHLPGERICFLCVHNTTGMSFLCVAWFLLEGPQEHWFQDNLVVWVGPCILNVLLPPCGCGSQGVFDDRFWVRIPTWQLPVGWPTTLLSVLITQLMKLVMGVNHSLNTVRSHTNLGKDRPQSGVDPASAIKNKPWSKDQRQTTWSPKPGSYLGWLRMCWAVPSPCVAESFPAGWWWSCDFSLHLRLSSPRYLGRKTTVLFRLSFRGGKEGCCATWRCSIGQRWALWIMAHIPGVSGPAMVCLQWEVGVWIYCCWISEEGIAVLKREEKDVCVHVFI